MSYPPKKNGSSFSFCQKHLSWNIIVFWSCHPSIDGKIFTKLQPNAPFLCVVFFRILIIIWDFPANCFSSGDHRSTFQQVHHFRIYARPNVITEQLQIRVEGKMHHFVYWMVSPWYVTSWSVIHHVSYVEQHLVSESLWSVGCCLESLRFFLFLDGSFAAFIESLLCSTPGIHITTRVLYYIHMYM